MARAQPDESYINRFPAWETEPEQDPFVNTSTTLFTEPPRGVAFFQDITEAEIEDVEQDDYSTKIVDAVVERNPEKYLALLIKKGVKLPAEFSVSTIWPENPLAGQNATPQMLPVVSQTFPTLTLPMSTPTVPNQTNDPTQASTSSTQGMATSHSSAPPITSMPSIPPYSGCSETLPLLQSVHTNLGITASCPQGSTSAGPIFSQGQPKATSLLIPTPIQPPQQQPQLQLPYIQPPQQQPQLQLPPIQPSQ
jgi:hypothetical protein